MIGLRAATLQLRLPREYRTGAVAIDTLKRLGERRKEADICRPLSEAYEFGSVGVERLSDKPTLKEVEARLATSTSN